MNELNDIEAMAADYVLGQLAPAERAAVTARLAHDPALAAAVDAWERRLGPLIDTVAPVAPPPHVFGRIEAVLDVRATPPRPGNDNIAHLSRRVRFWRRATFAAGALAASLAVFIVGQGMLRPQSPATLVAVLQKDAASPAFLMTVNVAEKTFTVRAVAPKSIQDKSYELWLVSDAYPHPQSLGVLNDAGYDSGRRLAQFAPAVVRQATYAVSLEPRGGSPTGLPTGPVVYAGKLVQPVP